MSKTFRPGHEFVPAGHVAHFVRDTVREGLGLAAILGSYVATRPITRG